MSPAEIFKSWLNSAALTPQEKKELLSLSQEEIESRFNDKPYSFGTSGIRLLTGLGIQRLNRFTYRLIGIGCGHYFKGKCNNPSVLVVHDRRKEGQKYSLEVASALTTMGVKVLLAPGSGSLSTPILSFLIKKKKLNGGISITASHNPIDYNGLKIFNDLGKQLNEAEEREFLTKLPPLNKAIEIEADNFHQFSFEILDIQEINGFINLLAQTISSNSTTKNIPVLFSSFGGTTTHFMEQLAHALHFPLFQEYEQKNNNLINPEDPASFLELSKKAEEENIRHIMCADLDGDRAAIAELQPNKKWYFFNGNEMGAMLVHFKNSTKPKDNPYIVSTHVTSTLINHLFPNIPIHLSKTGFKHIGEIVHREEKKGNLLIAFEEACGVLLDPIHLEKDSYQQIGYALELIHHLKTQNKTLLDYLEELSNTPIGHWRGWTDYYRVSRENLRKFTDEEWAQEIMKDSPLPLIKVDKSMEIIAWELENSSWIKFRYSGTEPKLKIYYNLFHKDKEQLMAWCEKMKNRFETEINK